MGDAEIKGSGFTSLLAAARQQKSGALVDRALASIKDDALHAKLRTNSVLPSSWVPIAWYRRVLHALAAQGLGDEEMRAVSKMSATRDVTGLYRVVFSVLSAELLAKQAPRLVALFYRGGTVTPVEVRDGYACAAYDGWHGFDRRVWLDYLHGTEAVFELAGAKGVATTIDAGGDGPSLRATATWS